MTALFISITGLIGRFHPALVHLPIGILLVGLLLVWLSRKEQYAISQQVIKVVLLCGIFSALASCITGYLLSLNVEYDNTLVALHMWTAIGLTLLAMLLFAKVASGQKDIVYTLSSVFLFIFILVTGHLGGSLTHGSDYFTRPLNRSKDTAAIKPVTHTLKANGRQPILQTKGYNSSIVETK